MEDEQQHQYHLHLLKGDSIPLQGQHREEQVGLEGVDFFGKPLALLEGHALDAQHRVDEIATRDRCHATGVQRRVAPTVPRTPRRLSCDGAFRW